MTAAARRLETCLRIADTPPSLRHNDLVARFLPASIGIAVSATGYLRADDAMRDAETACIGHEYLAVPTVRCSTPRF